jgi:hypothetical protein
VLIGLQTALWAIIKFDSFRTGNAKRIWQFGFVIAWLGFGVRGYKNGPERSLQPALDDDSGFEPWLGPLGAGRWKVH